MDKILPSICKADKNKSTIEYNVKQPKQKMKRVYRAV